MKNYRNTYVTINLKNIEENVKKIVNKYSNYKYFIGVVKADSYGHYDIKTVKAIIAGGCNYLAVSSLEEALVIRKSMKEIPIICLGYISEEFVEKCIKNNITITINSHDYLKKILNGKIKGLKIHLKIDTGMNRLGLKDEEEIIQTLKLIHDNNIFLEGIFTHIYDSQNEYNTNKQLDRFYKFIKYVDLTKTPIIHVFASEALVKYDANKIINGCRLGIIIYGFTTDRILNLKSTFSLVSEIIEIKKILKGETVSYQGQYKAKKDELIGIVPIGYADGIIRQNTGRTVYINNKSYKIIGNICMDMLIIKIDKTVKLHDRVELLKDNQHIKQVSKYLNTIPYEILCSISKRVPRIYIKK